MEDYFLKIDGIPGESTDAKHKDEIQLVSFSWGAEQQAAAPAGGGAGAGKPRFHDFRFTMRVNKASPLLFLATVTGQHIKEATLSVRRAGKQQLEYLKIKFGDVLVSSFEDVGAGDTPQETVAFAFRSIDVAYTPQSPAGGAAPPVTAGWDVGRNVKL